MFNLRPFHFGALCLRYQVCLNGPRIHMAQQKLVVRAVEDITLIEVITYMWPPLLTLRHATASYSLTPSVHIHTYRLQRNAT